MFLIFDISKPYLCICLHSTYEQIGFEHMSIYFFIFMMYVNVCYNLGFYFLKLPQLDLDKGIYKGCLQKGGHDGGKGGSNLRVLWLGLIYIVSSKPIYEFCGFDFIFGTWKKIWDGLKLLDICKWWLDCKRWWVEVVQEVFICGDLVIIECG